MVDHTVKAYDEELDAIERRIAEMGGIAEKMVIEAMDALSNADTVLAHEVVAADLRLDALQREIEEMAVMTIVRRQPVAVDLRELIGAIRIAGDLEQVGDLAKNIAKRTVKVGTKARVPRAIIGLKHMNDVATELLKDVLDAYAQHDEMRAREVWQRDIDLDELEDSVFRDLLTHMMEDRARSRFARISSSAPRTSSGSATTPQTSPKRWSIWSQGIRCRPSGRAAARRTTSSRRWRGRRMNVERKDTGRPNAASSPRILVVEDESDLALLLTYNLEAEGYLVERVDRGEEAELRLAESTPDLVILDWMLPGVSASRSAEGFGRARIRARSRSSW